MILDNTYWIELCIYTCSLEADLYDPFEFISHVSEIKKG